MSDRVKGVATSILVDTSLPSDGAPDNRPAACRTPESRKLPFAANERGGNGHMMDT